MVKIEEIQSIDTSPEPPDDVMSRTTMDAQAIRAEELTRDTSPNDSQIMRELGPLPSLKEESTPETSTSNPETERTDVARIQTRAFQLSQDIVRMLGNPATFELTDKQIKAARLLDKTLQKSPTADSIKKTEEFLCPLLTKGIEAVLSKQEQFKREGNIISLSLDGQPIQIELDAAGRPETFKVNDSTLYTYQVAPYSELVSSLTQTAKVFNHIDTLNISHPKEIHEFAGNIYEFNSEIKGTDYQFVSLKNTLVRYVEPFKETKGELYLKDEKQVLLTTEIQELHEQLLNKLQIDSHKESIDKAVTENFISTNLLMNLPHEVRGDVLKLTRLTRELSRKINEQNYQDREKPKTVNILSGPQKDSVMEIERLSQLFTGVTYTLSTLDDDKNVTSLLTYNSGAEVIVETRKDALEAILAFKGTDTEFNPYKTAQYSTAQGSLVRSVICDIISEKIQLPKTNDFFIDDAFAALTPYVQVTDSESKKDLLRQIGDAVLLDLDHGTLFGQGGNKLFKAFGREAIPFIQDSLSSASNEACESFVHTLMLTDSDLAVPILTSLAQHKSEDVQEIAAYALARIGNEAAIAPIIGWLKEDPDSIEAARVLLLIDDKGPAALRDLLGSDNPELTVAALQLLDDANDPNSTEEVRKLVSHENPSVKAIALSYLTHQGDRSTEPGLIKLLSEGQIEHEEKVLKALYSFGTDESYEAIQTYIVNAEHPPLMLEHLLSTNDERLLRGLTSVFQTSLSPYLKKDEYIVNLIDSTKWLEAFSSWIETDNSAGIEIMVQLARPGSEWLDILKRPDLDDRGSTPILKTNGIEALLASLPHSGSKSPTAIANRLLAKLPKDADETFRKGLELFIETRALNLQFPGRYSADTLAAIIKDRQLNKPDGRPLAIVTTPQTDWNGAFYNSGYIDQLVENGYRVMLYETGTEAEVLQALQAGSGQGLKTHQAAHTLVVSGHGSKYGILLSDSDEEAIVTEEQGLDVGDLADFSQKDLEGVLEKDGIILLVSCSTGEGREHEDNVANFFRKLFPDAKDEGIWSPTIPTSIETFLFGPDKRVKGIKYEVRPRENKSESIEYRAQVDRFNAALAV